MHVTTVKTYSTLESGGVNRSLSHVLPRLWFIQNWASSPSFPRQPQLPQTESRVFTGSMALLLAASVSYTQQLSKLQIKDTRWEKTSCGQGKPQSALQTMFIPWIRLQLECVTQKAQRSLLVFSYCTGVIGGKKGEVYIFSVLGKQRRMFFFLSSC